MTGLTPVLAGAVALAAVVVALASLRDPTWLLGAHLASRVILDSLSGTTYQVIAFGLSVMQVYTITFVAAAAALLLVSGRLPRMRLAIPLAVIVAAYALSGLAAGAWLGAAQGALRWIYLYILAALMCASLMQRGERPVLLMVWSILLYPMANQLAAVAAGRSVLNAGQVSYLGSFAHESDLSFLLLAVVPVSVALALATRSPALRAGCIGTALWAHIAIYLCNYRTAFVGLAAFWAVMVWQMWPRLSAASRVLTVSTGTVAMVLLGAGIGDVLLDRLADLGAFLADPGRYLDFSADAEHTGLMSGRVDILNRYMQLYLAAPLLSQVLGLGPGTGTTLVGMYAHNEFVSALVETGVVGLAALLLAVVMIWRSLREARHSGSVCAWALAPAAAAVALMALGTMPFRDMRALMLLGLIVGVCEFALIATRQRTAAAALRLDVGARSRHSALPVGSVTRLALPIFVILAVLPLDRVRAATSAPRHGHYSASYDSDWSNLALGSAMATRAWPTRETAPGPARRVQFHGRDDVHVRGLRLAVNWPVGAGKYDSTLVHVRGAKRVLIEDLDVLQLDGDYRAEATVLIEDSEEVVVRNARFAGTVSGYHLRIEGARRVLIDGVEVTGHDYGPDSRGMRAGGGIWVNNGPTNSPSPLDPEWAVIQNCYIHDNLDADRPRNQDAINVQSPRDGAIFNCHVRHWGRNGKVADAAIDVSYRVARATTGSFRIERNVIEDAFVTKTPGSAPAGNRILWVNNLYLDTEVAAYHGGYESVIAHNTFMLRSRKHVLRLWKMRPGGRIDLVNNVVHSPTPLRPVVYQNAEGVARKHELLSARGNVYLLGGGSRFLDGVQDARLAAFNAWQGSGRDVHGEASGADGCFERQRVAGSDVCVPAGRSVPLGATGDPFLEVSRDFSGRRRRPSPSPGAFESTGPGQ